MISRLEDAVAILIGKLNTGEFASGTVKLYNDLPYSLSANPQDLQRSAGWSSTGPWAGIGGRITLLAVGGDTGASIHLPASACGAQGLKPTFGRVSSSYAAISNAWSRDTAGPMAWDVEDLGYALEAMDGYDIDDPKTITTEPFKVDLTIPTDPKGRRVGVANLSIQTTKFISEQKAGIQKLIDLLATNGVETFTVDLPSKLADYSTVGSSISNIEFHIAN